MGYKIVKSKNLCCQLVVFTRLSLLRKYYFGYFSLNKTRGDGNSHWNSAIRTKLMIHAVSLIIRKSRIIVNKIKIFILFGMK